MKKRRALLLFSLVILFCSVPGMAMAYDKENPSLDTKPGTKWMPMDICLS